MKHFFLSGSIPDPRRDPRYIETAMILSSVAAKPIRSPRFTIDISVETEAASNLESDLRLILKDLGLEGRVRIENE
jgi:hypothetical protein